MARWNSFVSRNFHFQFFLFQENFFHSLFLALMATPNSAPETPPASPDPAPSVDGIGPAKPETVAPVKPPQQTKTPGPEPEQRFQSRVKQLRRTLLLMFSAFYGAFILWALFL